MKAVKTFLLFLTALLAVWSIIYFIFDITTIGVRIYDGALGNPFAWYAVMFASDIAISLFVALKYYNDTDLDGKYSDSSNGNSKLPLVVVGVAIVGFFYLKYI